jgi:glycosyltransferase involved in cell wall biosynthesis
MQSILNYTIIDTMYINNSGGEKLLNYLLLKISCISNNNKNFILIIDERFDSIYLKHFNKIFIVKSGEFSRFRIYNLIFKKYNITKIFTFNNLPPPINTKPSIIVNIYFHNLFLIYKSKFFSRSHLKFMYIKFLNKKHYNWIVQTNLTKKLLQKRLYNSIDIIPFFNDKHEVTNKKKFDFIYVAAALSQKNHHNLLQAWNKLSEKGIYPSLVLTIDDIERKHKQLSNLIILINSKGGNIINIGHVKSEILNNYYKNTYCLIYPSLFESFGLPLLEATNFNMSVVGSDLEYLNEIIDTKYHFNPDDFNSIANTVIKVYYNLKQLSITKPKITNNITKLIYKL